MLRHYIELALRNLRRRPWLNVLVMLSLGVGIGASMVTLCLLNVLAGDPIPGKSSRLYRVNLPTPAESRGNLDYAEARALATHSKDVEHVVLSSMALATVSAQSGANAEQAFLRLTSRGFFSLFDVPLIAGSPWNAENDQQGSPVAVVSKALAVRSFAAPQQALGAIIQVAGQPFRVIGVLDDWRPVPRFYGLDRGAYLPADDVYIPLGAARLLGPDAFIGFTCPPQTAMPAPSILPDTDCLWLSMWVQLNDAPSVARYERMLHAFRDEHPLPANGSDDAQAWLLDVHDVLQRADVVPGTVWLYTWLAQGLLLLAIISGAGVLLASFLARRTEIGIRRALGATRATVIAQYLCESTVVAAGGGLLGLGLTLLCMTWINSLPLGYADAVHIAPDTLALLVALVLVSGMLSGLFPAWRASQIDPALQAKGG